MQINFGKNFIVGFPGSEMNPTLAGKLKTICPAGVILFDVNFKSREQILKLTNDLKDLLGEDLIISTDEEGGKVQRLRRFVSPLPSMRALGMRSKSEMSSRGVSQSEAKTDDVVIQFNAEMDRHAPTGLAMTTKLLSHNLCSLNFNLAYSPCVDLNTEPLNPIIGPRSFGSDPDLVSKQAQNFIQELNKTSIISCAKHFPGHGASLSDSHLGLPKITYQNYQEFEKHLQPFKAAIAADVDMIMIAHLAIEILGDNKFTSEKDLPTSLSKKYIQELLRAELGFKGTVVSDEITMQALDRFGDYAKRAALMLEAGNDLIIWNTNIDDALEACQELNSRYNSELSKLYQDSQDRISKLKNKIKNQKKQTLAQDQIYKLEDSMLEIAKNAIEYKTNGTLDFNNAILLYNNHPKLERDITDRVFDIPKMEFSEEKSPCEFALDKFTNIIVLEFQTALKPKLKEGLSKLKAKRSNVTVISTDVISPDAGIVLNGCGELHFRALISYISSSQNTTVHFE